MQFGNRLIADLFRDSPLRHASYRLFYFGSVGAALGYTMQATMSAWLMATLTPSALMVALVQTASTAPALLFGLAAGALADIVDRRRIILISQAVLLLATAVLGGATLGGLIGPAALLAFTFVIGAGFAVYLPAQQASINDLVSRRDLARAVALGAVAFNLARAVGPALAGAMAAWTNTGGALLASALFFVVMIVAVRHGHAPVASLPGVQETVLSGIVSGLRYTRHSPPIKALISRNLNFSVCASALWALLPVVARDQLGLGADGFGVLLASFGIGAVVGALLMPHLLHRMSLNTVVTSGVILWAASTILIASTGLTGIALIGSCGAGAAWVGVLSSLSAGTQSAAPAWVRARAVSINLIANQASLAFGSAIWGWLATFTSTRDALSASAGIMLILLWLNRRARVEFGGDEDVTPGVRLPDLAITVEPSPRDGPVLIQLEYRVEPANRKAFLDAIQAMGPSRRRNGAADWRVFRDLGEDGLFIERFIVDSWAEYIRLRGRMTMTDRQVESHVATFQRVGVPIRVSRLISVDLQNA
jgi:MFS family permease